MSDKIDLENKLHEMVEDDVSLDDADDSDDADGTSEVGDSDASASVDSEPGPYEMAAVRLFWFNHTSLSPQQILALAAKKMRRWSLTRRSTCMIFSCG